MEPVTEGRRYLMKVENLLDAPGAYRGRLMLATDFPGKERIVVPVFGRIKAPLEAYPAKLILSPDRCPACKERRNHSGEVVLRSQDNAPFQVKAVKAEAEGLRWDLETLVEALEDHEDVRLQHYTLLHALVQTSETLRELASP